MRRVKTLPYINTSTAVSPTVKLLASLDKQGITLGTSWVSLLPCYELFPNLQLYIVQRAYNTHVHESLCHTHHTTSCSVYLCPPIYLVYFLWCSLQWYGGPSSDEASGTVLQLCRGSFGMNVTSTHTVYVPLSCCFGIHLEERKTWHCNHVHNAHDIHYT